MVLTGFTRAIPVACLASYQLSTLGNAIAGIALPLIVLQVTGSALGAGAVALGDVPGYDRPGRPVVGELPDQLDAKLSARIDRLTRQPQLVPGWPYSFVAAVEAGRTSWTQVLDAVRLGPAGVCDIRGHLFTCGEVVDGSLFLGLAVAPVQAAKP